MIEKLSLPIIERNEIAKDTIEIRFGLDKKKKFKYKAGQYVSIVIPDKVTDGRGKMRSFSLSTSPNNSNYIATCFRVPEKLSDFKRYILDYPFGTKIKIDGPRGVFILPEETNKHIVMIAGGVGIVPFMSMIKYSAEEKTAHQITLLYTDKTERRMSYFDELVKLEVKDDRFNFINRFKRVDKKFIEKYCDIKNSVFYVCGTPKMVMGVRKMLEKMKVDSKNIKFENFTGY